MEVQAVEATVDSRLSASKIQILRLLGQRGAQTSTQVARFLGVSKPAVSQIIDTMVASRLVVRRPATDDRREVRLELTKKGRQVFQTLRRQQRHYIRTALRQLPNADPDEIANLMRDISRALARADTGFKHHCLQCGAHTDSTCVLTGGDARCTYLKHVPPCS
jgi:DNA-binding MarR family transcriptional regulator